MSDNRNKREKPSNSEPYTSWHPLVVFCPVSSFLADDFCCGCCFETRFHYVTVLVFVGGLTHRDHLTLPPECRVKGMYYYPYPICFVYSYMCLCLYQVCATHSMYEVQRTISQSQFCLFNHVLLRVQIQVGRFGSKRPWYCAISLVPGCNFEVFEVNIIYCGSHKIDCMPYRRTGLWVLTGVTSVSTT